MSKYIFELNLRWKCMENHCKDVLIPYLLFWIKVFINMIVIIISEIYSEPLNHIGKTICI